MKQERKDPPVSRELVEWFEGTFPDRLPEHPMDLNAINVRIGEARVVRKLRQLYEKQTTTVGV